MQPIMVTGGAGFIGAHTCKALAAQGLHPIAFDNLSRGHREECSGARWFMVTYSSRPILIGHLRNSSLSR